MSSARPSALVVVSSACQLFSGTGTVLFDWLRHARDAIDFSLLVDTGEATSFEVAARFCRETGIEFIVSGPESVPGCPDHRPSAAARVLRSRPWDIVECISWASAATNLDVLNNRPPGSVLVYTPHTQPLWTLAHSARFFMVMPIFEATLKASDLVIAITPHEFDETSPEILNPARIAVVPNGVDTARFHPGTPRAGNPPRVLCVADFREHRKRPDLILRALSAACAAHPGLVPVIAGRDSNTLALPPGLHGRAKRLGYISDAELLRQYHSARVLLLLSDYEAFGMPIAEALCCGTKVVINEQRETASVFADLPGVRIVRNTDTDAVRDALLAAISEPEDRARIAAAASERFASARTNARKLERLLACLPAHRATRDASGQERNETV